MPATVRRTLQQLSNLYWLMPLPINASHRSELTMAILSITIVILISDLSKPLTLLVTTFRVPLSQRPGDFRNFLNQRIQENRNVGATRKISALPGP